MMMPSRRELLQRTGIGFGAIGLASLLGDTGALTAHAADSINPLEPKLPTSPPKRNG